MDRLTFFKTTRRRFPVSYATNMENITDPGHLMWAHHGSSGMSNRNMVSRNEGMDILEDCDDGVDLLATLRNGEGNVVGRVGFIAPFSVF